MNKLLILFFCLCLAQPVFAEDVAVSEAVVEQVENKAEEAINTDKEQQQAIEQTVSEEHTEETNATLSEELLEKVDEENALNSPKQPEYEELRDVKEEIVPMPSCDDEQLQKETSKYINDYFNLTPNEGTLFRRRRYFILHNLDKFKEENIANYKTDETSPVSDIIAATKVNKGIAEENLRLCKNIAKDKYAGRIYLLIYPEQNGVRVRVINLVDRQRIDDEASFFYENKSE